MQEKILLNYRGLRGGLLKNDKMQFQIWLISLFLASLSVASLVQAEVADSTELNAAAAEEEIVGNDQNTELQSDISNEEVSKKFVEIQKNLNATKSDLSQVESNTSYLEQRLGDVTDQILTLEGQLASMDEQIDKTERRIVLISINIQKNEETLEALLAEIKLIMTQMEKQKARFEELLLLLYFKSEQVGFFDRSDLQTIKLLLNEENVADMLLQISNLSILEYSLIDLTQKLEAGRQKLEADRKKVMETTKQLTALKTRLDEELLYMSLQRSAKTTLLEATKGEERLYKQLLTKAREEQLQIRRELIDLLKVYADYKGILDQSDFANEDFTLSGVLSWPVLPQLGISAYFKDASYKKALGVEHRAIDVRTPQGTTVVAPADGVVLKTKGGEGTDYHYIVLGHGSEVMTLYGHMFDIFVKAGDSVNRGDAIGLSGGMPGTKGAGWLTTGPHLHFEVFKDGVHVDPLEYLDLTKLPARYR